MTASTLREPSAHPRGLSPGREAWLAMRRQRQATRREFVRILLRNGVEASPAAMTAELRADGFSVSVGTVARDLRTVLGVERLPYRATPARERQVDRLHAASLVPRRRAMDARRRVVRDALARGEGLTAIARRLQLQGMDVSTATLQNDVRALRGER